MSLNDAIDRGIDMCIKTLGTVITRSSIIEMLKAMREPEEEKKDDICSHCGRGVVMELYTQREIAEKLKPIIEHFTWFNSKDSKLDTRWGTFEAIEQTLKNFGVTI